MAISIYTGPRTFTEIASRQRQQKFGAVTSLVCCFEGLDMDFNGWVPILGATHPDFPAMFLMDISKKDIEGGLVEVTLSYAGNDQPKLKTVSGVPFSNLQTSISLAAKSFSWQGPAAQNGTTFAVQVNFSSQYTTIEVTFSYTAYAYPNGGQFGIESKSFVQLVNRYFVLNETNLAAGTYSGFQTLPAAIEPYLMLTRFTARQSSPSKYSNSATFGAPTVVTTPGTWDIQETWSLEYNLKSLGLPEANYSPLT